MRDDALPDFSELLYGRQEYTEFSTAELRDRRVPDYGYNVLNQAGALYTPVVDHAHLDAGGDRPSWPGDAPFAVCLTHDVDSVSQHSVRQTLRTRLLRSRMALESETGDYLAGIGVPAAAKSLVGAGIYAVRDALYRGRDPLHCYERWLEIEDQYDATSTWFVLPEETRTPHVSDSDYRYDDTVRFDGERRTVAEMLAAIADRDREIGLHPSWYAYDDADKLQRQRTALENAVGCSVDSVRQHYLHYDPQRTPQAHDDAGLRFDSTVGFNKNVGFRRGSSYPWHPRDPTTDDALDLLEIPLVVQDVGLFRDRGLNLDANRALEYVELLANRVQQTGGVLTLSWHPRTVADDQQFRTYERVLDRLNEMGAWLASVEEIGTHWLENGVTHDL